MAGSPDRKMIYRVKQVGAKPCEENGDVDSLVQDRQLDWTEPLPGPCDCVLLPLAGAKRVEWRREVWDQRQLALDGEGEARLAAEELEHPEASHAGAQEEGVQRHTAEARVLGRRRVERYLAARRRVLHGDACGD